jgi:predicted ATPase
VKGSIDVASIADKMTENSLRWFGNVMRREETIVVRIFMKINVERKSSKNDMKMI